MYDYIIQEEYNGVIKDEIVASSSDEAKFLNFHTPLKKWKGVSLQGEEHHHITKGTLAAIFLPQGYPYTVTDDYLQYQIWDTIQAFASSLTGALATTAVFRGVGVGSESASVLAASVAWLLRDGVGMLGRIAFAWARGTALDSDCKKWRLIADVLNDLAFSVDLLAAHFPASLFTPIACTSSLLRSIVGVAGGATRTAIIRHQARRDNLADVAAKDGSQETVVNLVSLLVSLVLLPLLDGASALTWLCFALFTIFHLFANYRAVRSLHLDVFNRNRLALCVRHFMDTGNVLSIISCNEREPIFAGICGERFYGCRYAQIRAINTQIDIHSTTAFLCAYTSRTNIGYAVLSANITTQEMFDAAFYVEFYAVVNRWPTIEEVNAFREKSIAAGWRLDAFQLRFDEWRVHCGTLPAHEKFA